MELNEYQKKASTTRTDNTKGMGVLYTTLGLVGEAGEVAEKVKKMFRDDDSVLTDERKKSLGMELGDVLWYLSQVALDIDMELEDVAKLNLEKLSSRMKREKIKGDGDTR